MIARNATFAALANCNWNELARLLQDLEQCEGTAVTNDAAFETRQHKRREVVAALREGLPRVGALLAAAVAEEALLNALRRPALSERLRREELDALYESFAKLDLMVAEVARLRKEIKERFVFGVWR